MKLFKGNKAFSTVIAFALVLQLLPLNYAFAATGIGTDPQKDLTGTGYLTVHGPNYADPSQASSLKITQADGKMVIEPDAEGNYSEIPASAKVVLDYAFSLEDGEGSTFYDYDGSESFTATLPKGLDFTATKGTVVATDTVDVNYDLANWKIEGNLLTFELTSDTEDTLGKGGAAKDDHKGKWGKLHIEGTFHKLNAGDPTEETITFGATTITIKRQPLPMKSTLDKIGVYDASTNSITWTVKVTPPAGAPNMTYNDFSVVDEFSANQDYVLGSFTVGGAAIPDASLTIAGSKITYTFQASPPHTTGEQKITYQTRPTTFSAENGTSATAKYSTYTNVVNLMRGEDTAADPVNSAVTIDWINKTGIMAPIASDPSIAKWTIDVTVPGESGKSITGAVITDAIPADLELLVDATHDVSIKFGNDAATILKSDEYNYAADNVLTYRFPDESLPTAGTKATLTFYTKVTKDSWNKYLDSNNSIAFRNSAKLSWNENTTTTSPSDKFSINNGIGGGGLLVKYGDPDSDYSYSAADPGTLHWRVLVNRNRIDIKNAVLTDTLPLDQLFLIDATHPLTVNKEGAKLESFDSKVSAGNFTYTDPNNISYIFPEEKAGTGTISSTYIVDYYTRVADPTGISALYTNGRVQYKNMAKLTRDGATTVNSNASHTYRSQMLAKNVCANYNYNEHTVQWRIIANHNKLPLTNAVVTDKLPEGMTLLIDAKHPVSIRTALDGGEKGVFSGDNGDASLTYTLPASTSDEHTIMFWTKLSDEVLKTQWNGEKDFENNASLISKELVNPITTKISAKVRNPVITKDYHYTAGSDTIDWSVEINPAQVTLEDAVVTDALNSNLKLDPKTVKLYTVSINPRDGKVIKTTGEVSDADYKITLPTEANGNKLSVALPTPTSSAYRLDFSTVILTDDINLTNTVELTGSAGPTGNADSTRIEVNDLYSNGGSGKNSITVHKTDSGLLAKPLAGATFRLLNVNKQPIKNHGKEITATTLATGDAVFSGLPSWVFYVEEIEPPTGYLRSADPIMVIGGKDGEERLNGDATISITNAPALGRVSFSKLDSHDNSKLSEGKFTLTGKSFDGKEITLISTSMGGTVTFDGVPLGDDYTIKETSPPTGFKLSNDVLKASVKYNTDKTAVLTEVTPNILLNDRATSISCFAQIIINKTDEKGFKLAGAEFMLYNVGGTSIATAVSDENGVAVFDHVVIGGSYTIKETKAPSGYVASADSVSVKITSGTAQSLTIVNKKDTAFVGALQIVKVDKDYHPLAGAEFTLYDKDGKEIGKSVSSSDGLVIFEGLVPGKYSVKETVAPAGYILFTESLEFQITEDESVKSYTLKDTKIADDSDVAGWSDENVDDGGTLPKTGGISGTFFVLLAGVCLLLAGLLTSKVRINKKKHLFQNKNH